MQVSELVGQVYQNAPCTKLPRSPHNLKLSKIKVNDESVSE